MHSNERVPRILVIDDDEALQRALKRAAEAAGYDVTQAFDGGPGLELARSEAFDLVLLDVNMPHSDGRDVLSKLRSDPDTATLPVIIFSSRGDRLARLQGLELGADDYIEKPFEPALLMRKIARRIEKSRERAASST